MSESKVEVRQLVFTLWQLGSCGPNGAVDGCNRVATAGNGRALGVGS